MARNYALSVKRYGIHLLILKKHCTPNGYSFSLSVWFDLEILFLLFKAAKYKQLVVYVYITVINEINLSVFFFFRNPCFFLQSKGSKFEKLSCSTSSAKQKCFSFNLLKVAMSVLKPSRCHKLYIYQWWQLFFRTNTGYRILGYTILHLLK